MADFVPVPADVDTPSQTQHKQSDFVPVPADVDTPPQTQRKQRNQQGYQAYQLSPEDQAYTNHLAAQTIEYLFSADNLAQDPYLRSLFDVEGWVPLLYVAQYPQVAYMGADWSGLKKRIAESRVLEWDASNETIRVRENWKMWVQRGVTIKYSMPKVQPGSPSGTPAAESGPAATPTDIATDTTAAGSEANSAPAVQDQSQKGETV